MSKVYLGLGSNLGDREENMRKAIQLIGERVGKVTKQSSFIETAPWGYESENRFLNAVVLCETSKKPREVLLLTQQIERDLGRKTKRHFKKNDVGSTSVETESYSDRPIDIDILLYDDLTVDEPDLQIPHPLMQERDFVMIPLKELTNP
jgi:2-amino-4-hydroxy-6-hydroxymethyldihydropteridine diphosphokinase